MQPRRYRKKLPLQANFYPMPVMACLQDAQSRLTLHAAQALGVSSLHDGEGSRRCSGGEGKLEKPIPATEAYPLCGPLRPSCPSVTHQREMKGRQTHAVTLSPGGGSCGGDWGWVACWIPSRSIRVLNGDS